MTKRIISILLAVMMILTVLPLTLASANDLGDVNDDGSITAADARLALRASVGLETLTEAQKLAANVNFDEEITAADARLILRASVGLEELHSHEYKTETVITAATCTAAGEKKLSCECGEFITEAIPAKGHTAVTDKAVAATCTSEGKTEGSHCSVCGHIIKAQTTVNKTNHTPVTDKAVAPTCTSTGKTEGSHCSVCGYVIKAQATVNKTNHTPALDKATVKAATCKEDGYTGDKKCTVCKALISRGAAIKSTGTEHVLELKKTEATCGQPGYEVKQCKFCDYYDESSYKETAEALDHIWSHETKVSPTCTEEGYTSRTCTRCNAMEKNNSVAAKGHSYSWETETEATCTKTGIKNGTCTRCNATATEIIPLAAHSIEAVHITGKEAGSGPCYNVNKCTVCDTEISRIEFHKTRMLRNDPDNDGTPGIAATCTAAGTVDEYCPNCEEYGDHTVTFDNKEYSVNTIFQVDPLGHLATKNEELSYDATCEKDGVWVYSGDPANNYICKREGCNEVLNNTEMVVKAKGHSYSGTQTCTTDVICTNSYCDYEDGIIKERFGHDNQLSTDAYNKEITTFFCARCGEETGKTNQETIDIFNNVANSIKTYQFYSAYSENKYPSAFSKTSIKTSYSRFDFGAFTPAIRDLYEEEMANTPDEYSSIQDRHILWSLPVDNSAVSYLTASDIDSIDVERLSGIKMSAILSSFNPTYTNEAQTEKYNNIRNIEVSENVIKVAVDVRNEKYSEVKNIPADTDTSLQKIYGFDVREDAKQYIDQPPLTDGGDGFSISMNMNLKDIATDAKVTYYFLESTYEPIVAIYESDVKIDQEIDMTFQIGLFSLDGEMDPIIETKTSGVYVFPKFLVK